MTDIIPGYSSDFAIGDRVVLGEGAGEYVGAAGIVLRKEQMYSIYYGRDVYVIDADDGERLAAFKNVIIKSPYQNEPLEEVPNV